MSEQPTATERATLRFQEAKGELHAFLTDPDIRDILQEYESLVRTYNERLDTALRSLKNDLRQRPQDKLVMNGLGCQKKYKRWYDVDFLANALPAEQSDLILTEHVTYTLDRDQLEQLLRQGEIDSEIVRKSYHEEEQNPANMPGTPKPYNIPGLPELEDG
jgi:hypothetical protein